MSALDLLAAVAAVAGQVGLALGVVGVVDNALDVALVVVDVVLGLRRAGVRSRCLGFGGESLRASPAEPTAASYATWAPVSVAWRWPVFRGVVTGGALLAKREMVGKPC